MSDLQYQPTICHDGNECAGPDFCCGKPKPRGWGPVMADEVYIVPGARLAKIGGGSQSLNRSVTSTAEQEVREWRAREAAAFALYPIMDREGLGACAAGELADAAISTYLRVVSEELPEGWKRYVQE